MAGVVQGIRIVTDPEARMYLKKKAFLLGIRVMGRYGRDGWTCTEAEPGAGRTRSAACSSTAAARRPSMTAA